MKIRTLLIGATALALLGIPVALMLTVWSLVTSMAPVPQVLQQLSSDPAVTVITGTPLRLRMWGGSLHINDGSSGGRATMDTTAYGPAGAMHFTANATRSGTDPRWTVIYLAIFPQGERVVRIDADHPAPLPPAEAPDPVPAPEPMTGPVATRNALFEVVGVAILMVLSVVALIIFLLGSLGPLPALQRRYPETPSDLPPLRLGSLRIGKVGYNNCVRLGLTQDALFIRWGFPIAWRRHVVRVPLTDLHDPVVTRSWLASRVTCALGDERRVMVLPLWLFESSEAGRGMIGQ